MNAFVRRLIERLHDAGEPLSRNRHFHTFETPEGKAALKISKRLKGLQRDIRACFDEGRTARVIRRVEGEQVRIELTLDRVRGRRTSVLTADELELLERLPGVREALATLPAPPSP